jgi:hypothetical protein
MLYVRKINLIYASIVGYCNQIEISEASKILESNKSRIKAATMLVDTSKLGVLRDIDRNKIVHELFPIFRSIGIGKAAFIHSDDVFGQLSLRQLLPHVQKSEIQVFNNIHNAEEWLLHSTLKEENLASTHIPILK